MRLVSLFFACSIAAIAQTGSIEGVSVNSTNGQPLAGVHVRLVSGINGGGGVNKVYGAISDKSGHFSITQMEPGSYIMYPDYPGFIYLPPKEASSPFPGLPIKAGEKVESYRLLMTPAAILSGRVVDDYGDPVFNVPVSVSPVSPEDQRINLFGGQNSSTNDRGEFRVITAPGKFYLKAEPFQNSNEAPEIRTDGSSDTFYGATFYPNAASRDRATQIEAVAGKEMGGIEIRLVRMRILTISGIVTGLPDTGARPTVMMRFGESERQLNNSRAAGVGADGRFSFSRLAPGFYRFTAVYNTGQTRLQSAPVDVKLDSGDETNVELALTAGGDLTGRLQLEGIPAGKRSVRVESADGQVFMMNPDSKPLSADVNADGAFQIPSVPPGKYKVMVEPLPENGYIKTVQLDGVAAPDDVLDLSRGARNSRLTVVASGNGARISGKVLDKDGQTIANSLTFVFLMTDPKAPPQPAMVRVSPEGTYLQKGIRPGKYHLFALDLLHYMGGAGAIQSNDFSEPFARGEEIELKEGDAIVKDLKVLEKEGGNGK